MLGNVRGVPSAWCRTRRQPARLPMPPGDSRRRDQGPTVQSCHLGKWMPRRGDRRRVEHDLGAAMSIVGNCEVRSLGESSVSVSVMMPLCTVR